MAETALTAQFPESVELRLHRPHTASYSRYHSSLLGGPETYPCPPVLRSHPTTPTCGPLHQSLTQQILAALAEGWLGAVLSQATPGNFLRSSFPLKPPCLMLHSVVPDWVQPVYSSYGSSLLERNCFIYWPVGVRISHEPHFWNISLQTPKQQNGQEETPGCCDLGVL